MYRAFGREYIASCSREGSHPRPSYVVSAVAISGDVRRDVTDEVERRMGPQNDCHGIAGGDILLEWFDGSVDKLSVETLEGDFLLRRV